MGIFAHVALVAHGAVIEGTLPRSARFNVLVGMFCFDSSPRGAGASGTVSFELAWDDRPPMVGNQSLKLMAFDDEGKHWKRIAHGYEVDECGDLEAAASYTKDLGHEIQRSHQHVAWSNFISQHARPRFWYFVIVNCGVDLTSTTLGYKVHFTNTEWGWQQEFSMDHMGMFWVYLVLAACFGFVALLTAWAVRRKCTQQAVQIRAHPYIQLLSWAHAASTTSAGLFLAHYCMYMDGGYGSLGLRFLAILFAVVANCTIYLIALLSSRGWAITTGKLSHQREFFVLVTVVGGLHAMCELHAQTTLDASARLYAYDGVAGIVSVALKLMIFQWFVANARKTLSRESDERRKKFYKLMYYGMSIQALMVPSLVVVALGVDPWVRYKVVAIVEIVARFAGQCFLSYLILGPMTPISAENTFQANDRQEACFLESKEVPLNAAMAQGMSA